MANEPLFDLNVSDTDEMRIRKINTNLRALFKMFTDKESAEQEIDELKSSIDALDTKTGNMQKAFEAAIANTTEKAQAAQTAGSDAQVTADNALTQSTNTSKHFWHDTAGAHVATVANQGDQGMNSLWDDTDLHFRNGTDDLARFGANGSQLGKDDEAHLVMDANSMELYDENNNRYFFAGDKRDLVTGKYEVTDTHPMVEFISDTWNTVYPTDAINSVSMNGTELTEGVDWNSVQLPGMQGRTVILTTMPSSSDVLEITYDVTRQFLAYSLGGDARGMGSVAEGNSTATGEKSHAEGYYTASNGSYSHSEGYASYAQASQSHAEGWGTTTYGSGAHSEGRDTTAAGIYSHAEGQEAYAAGTASHAEGVGTRATAEASHAGGKFNVLDAFPGVYAETIGNGTDGVNRSNARTLDWNGNEELQGTLYVGGCTANGETPYSVARYNTSSSDLEYYDGTQWDAISTGSSTQTGDLTYDTSTGDTKYWDGSAWQMATPAGLVYGGSIVKNVSASREITVFSNAETRSMFHVASGDEDEIGITISNGDYGAQAHRITSVNYRSSSGWNVYLDGNASSGGFRFNYIVFVPKSKSTV